MRLATPFYEYVYKYLALVHSQRSKQVKNKIKTGYGPLPLLFPSGPRRMVHSSIVPKGANNCLTSSSLCCLLSIPTNSFRSATTNINTSVQFYNNNNSYNNINNKHQNSPLHVSILHPGRCSVTGKMPLFAVLYPTKALSRRRC